MVAQAPLQLVLLGLLLVIPHRAAAWHFYHINNTASPIYPNKTSTLLEIRDSTYGARNVSYWVSDDGLAVIDGDVIYGTIGDLLSHNVTSQTPIAKRAHSIFHNGNPWASATITYNFNSDTTEKTLSPIVNGAIANWKAISPYLAFKKIANSGTGQNGVLTIKVPSCGGCNSVIGFSNSPMTMNLQQTCTASPGSCGIPEATHEFGHVLGLYHEHQRFDREKFVHYNCANLNPSCPVKTVMPAGKTCCSSGLPSGCCANAGNFNIISGFTIDAAGAYDIHSIMQYRANAFAIPGKNILTPVAAGIVIPVNNPSSIDSNDSNRVCKIYASKCPKARACAVAGCPTKCVPVRRCNKPSLCDNPRTAPPCCSPVSSQTCARARAACTRRGCDFLK